MTRATGPIRNSYITVVATCLAPAPADGGPREVNAELIEVFYEIDADGVHETGHRVLHSGPMMLTTDGGDAYLDGDNR